MRSYRPLLSRLVVLGAALGPLAACPADKTDTDTDAGGGTTTDTTTGSPTTSGTTTEPTSGSTTAAMTEPGGETPDCSAQTDRPSCEALEFPAGDVSRFCTWIDWTPVTLEGDVCSFGAPQGKCVHNFAGSEGCASFETCGKPIAAVWKQDGDQISLAYASVCINPPEGSLCGPLDAGEDDGSPPECACTCKPEFSP